MVLDSRFLNYGLARIIVFTTSQTSEAQIDALRKRSVQANVFGEKRVDLVAALGELDKAGVKTLLVEGGGTLNDELLKQDLVD